MSASGAVHSPAQVTGTTSTSVERAVIAARSPLSSRASSERQDFFGGDAGVLAGFAGPPCGFAAGVTVGVGVGVFEVGAFAGGVPPGTGAAPGVVAVAGAADFAGAGGGIATGESASVRR